MPAILSVKRQLADLPQPVAIELAVALDYQKGDELELHMDVLTWSIKISNKRNRRHAILDNTKLDLCKKQVGTGNNIFLSPWEGQKVTGRMAPATKTRLDARWGIGEDDPEEALRLLLSITNTGIMPRQAHALQQLTGRTVEPNRTPISLTDLMGEDEPTEPKQKILVVAGDAAEAVDFAENVIGGQNTWVYIDSYIKLQDYKGQHLSLYVVGTAEDRPDYESLASLFHEHTVMDMNE